MVVDAARAKSLFLAASDLADPAGRAAYLDRECGGDAELRARVEALLRANDAAPPPPAEEANRTGAYTPNDPNRTEDYGDPTARVGSVLAGKYKLVEEVGEGGMGSVYMAQQTEPVKRAVAVKVIKAGMDSRAVLARFEAERQALAMMDHPNIAKVLDAGTTDGGRPFFVMELVKGTPITRYCDEHKLTPRQRLELFVPVCQAIQHAHQKGVIHRDIKPSNVLVALYDDKPVPKVIDFGVAKAAGQALTDKTLMTGFGAVVGTPEYMSPEQANLNNLDVDTRSDVYSLGVLLYELLTGATPVDRRSLGKAAILEVLRIVREVEAPRPSAKLSSIDTLPSVAANRGTEPAKLSRLMKGELDWLVMKALEKDRARRYESANGLARDVLRYLADEVVEARPPSAAYRLKKFVRRHKGQVIAATLVLAALLAGILGTAWGMFEARNKEAAAVQARNDLAEKNTELEQSQDQLEGALARTWLSPLAEAPGPLNDAERGALSELVTFRKQRLAERFVAEAVRSEPGRRKLRVRSAFALHAAVGLDPRERQKMETQLVRVLEDPELANQAGTEAALSAAALGGLSPHAAAVAARILVQALARTNDPNALGLLARNVAAVADRLEAQEALKAADGLARAMTRTTDYEALEYLEQGLSALAARLEAGEAADVAATLTQAMKDAKKEHVQMYLARTLAAVAARLEPRAAARVSAEAAATLTRAMTNADDFINLAWGLSAVAARLEPHEAAETAGALTLAMPRVSNPGQLLHMADTLSALAARMEPREASRASARGAAALAQGLNNLYQDHRDQVSSLNNDREVQKFAESFAPLAERMEPPEAAQAATEIAQLMNKADFPIPSIQAKGLAAVTARMEPRKAAVILAQAMTSTKNPNVLPALADGLAAVAPCLEAREAAEIAAALTQAMNEPKDVRSLELLARSLAVMARRMEPEEGPRATAQIAAVLMKDLKTGSVFFFISSGRAQALSALAAGMEPGEASRLIAEALAAFPQDTSELRMPLGARMSLVRGLSALAAHLERREAEEVAAKFTQVMSDTNNSIALQILAQSLPSVAAHLEPREANRVLAQAATTLAQKMIDAKNGHYDLAEGLMAVADSLEPGEAGQLAATLTQAMTTTNDPNVLQAMAKSLSAVAARLEPREALRVSAQAADRLTQIMNDAKEKPDVQMSLACSLAAIAGRLEPRRAAEVAAALTRKMIDLKSRPLQSILAQGVVAAAARLEPREAAAALTQALETTLDPDPRKTLLQALLALAARLESRESTDVAATLTQSMKNAKDEYLQLSLAQSLAAVAAHLERREAARVFAQIAATLAQAMTKSNDINLLKALAQNLSAVATRLESRDAAEIAVMLTQAIVAPHPEIKELSEFALRDVQTMFKTNDYYYDYNYNVLKALAQGLTAVAGRLEPREAAEVAAMLTQAMTKSNGYLTQSALTGGLSALLGNGRRLEHVRSVAATVGFLPQSQGLPGALVLLEPAAEPLPQPLSDQQLVELLRHPLCVGPARRTVLDQLEERHQRKFADQWDFVRHAEEQKLGLDFTGSPQRP